MITHIIDTTEFDYLQNKQIFDALQVEHRAAKRPCQITVVEEIDQNTNANRTTLTYIFYSSIA